MLGETVYLVGRLDRVGDDELFQVRLIDAGDGTAREDAVGDIAIDRAGALLQQRIGGVQ